MKYLDKAVIALEAHKGTIFASLHQQEAGLRLHEICQVPKKLSPSGRARITRFRWIKRNKTDVIASFWAIHLEPISNPEDPCDNDFMKDISS